MTAPVCERIGGCLTDTQDRCVYCDADLDALAVRTAAKRLMRPGRGAQAVMEALDIIKAQARR